MTSPTLIKLAATLWICKDVVNVGILRRGDQALLIDFGSGQALNHLEDLGISSVERILFTETTTFGVRRRTCQRSKLLRRHETVETPYGPIRVKVGRLAEEEVTAAPEFSDCRAAAEAHHVPVREVYRAAAEQYHKGTR